MPARSTRTVLFNGILCTGKQQAKLENGRNKIKVIFAAHPDTDFDMIVGGRYTADGEGTKLTLLSIKAKYDFKRSVPVWTKRLSIH